MGGEFWSTIVYGFEVKFEYVKLRGGGKNICIGSKSRFGYPVYYCTDLNHIFKKDIDVMGIQNYISKLDEKELQIMSDFDVFAKKYGFTPSWQLCCVGDFEVKIVDDSKKEIIARLCKWKNGLIKTCESIYNDDGSYNKDAIEDIRIILSEEGMNFIVKDAIKTKNIDEIISMINEYYSM